MLDWIKNHKYVLIIPAYGLFYIIAFLILEVNLPKEFVLIHTAIDDFIPFFEGFIIFYYYWFAYMAVTIFSIVNSSKENFLRTAVFLMTGMTLFVIISIVCPNGHDLRPCEFERDNIFVALTKFIYSTDPPRNMLPSIHVFNSIGCHIGFTYAIKESDSIVNKKRLCAFSSISCCLITISTLFVKQHSIVDVSFAILLSILLFYPCFKSKFFSRFA